MSVFKRKTSAGESKYYNYRFKINGKVYFGICYANNDKRKATTRIEAETWEKYIKQKAIDLAKQRTVKALVENFREEMTGGSPVSLNDAFEESLKKPCRSKKKRAASSEVVSYKRSYWRDFVDYISKHYPDIRNLADIRKKHAEEYIQYIREHGRFNKDIPFKAGRRVKTYTRKGNLSNKSCNAFQQTISEIFEKLYDDAGLIENPFSKIPLLENEYQSREAFSEKELKLIRDNADDFIRPLFCIGIGTALREGDICTLKWSEIDFKEDIIKRAMAKTGRFVEIPLTPPLRNFLILQKELTGKNDYVLPEHANMYFSNRTGVSLRVKNFLEKIGIKTTKKVKGRDRAISIKDVHSLRHTFCYYAGVYGVPFLVVKAIVGHVSREMTDLYQRHADNNLKREKLLQMPDFMGLNKKPALIPLDSGLEESKKTLLGLINASYSAEKIQQCIQIMKEIGK